jgi:hypothetical protein
MMHSTSATNSLFHIFYLSKHTTLMSHDKMLTNKSLCFMINLVKLFLNKRQKCRAITPIYPTVMRFCCSFFLLLLLFKLLAILLFTYPNSSNNLGIAIFIS